jgi:2-iminoacetate synthase
MLRLRVNRSALIAQVRDLAKMGFSHFELSGGDDLIFLQNELYDTVKAVKSVIDEITSGGRLSICLTPLMAGHYEALRELGLDTVLTWQETYDRDTFQTLITKGPKANGIDDNFCLVRGGDGFLSRASSQERAVKAGLQVGIGVMLGLAPNPEADILATVLHGQHLLSLGGPEATPLIIGMPTWNPITTTAADNRSSWHRPFEANDVFEIISAIYLLCFADYKAWVFPNCRVPMETQVRSIRTAGVFTSTMVRVGPGAYLADTAGADAFNEIFQASSEDSTNITREDVLQGEQFQHHFHSHAEYVQAFMNSGIHVVTDATLLKMASQ